MANLLEALKQKPQMQDTTSQVSKLLQAQSGKGGRGPTYALSTQAEEAAQAETARQMAPVQQQAAIQQAGEAQEAAGIEQQKQIQTADVAQSREANRMQTQLRTSQLLQDLEQGRGRIELGKYQASLEQVGQNLRLSNREYVDNLQREGSRARLNDKAQFEEQLNRSILLDNKSLLEKQLGNKSILTANDREFRTSMEELGIQDAYNIFRNELKEDRDRQLYAGIGSLITTGIGAYGTYKEGQEKKAYYTTGAGKEDTSYDAYKYGSPAARGK